MVFQRRNKKRRDTKKKKILDFKRKGIFVIDECYEDNFYLVPTFENFFNTVEKDFNIPYKIYTEDQKANELSLQLYAFIQERLELMCITTGRTLTDLERHKKTLYMMFFYSVLKNNGFECEKADEYFEVLNGGFSQIDWKLYFKMISLCEWGDLFSKSLLQVSDTAALSIMNSAFTYLDKKNDIVLCFALLQFLIIKLFNQETIPVLFDYESDHIHKKDFNDFFCDILEFIRNHNEKQKFTPVLLTGFINMLSFISSDAFSDKKWVDNLKLFVKLLESLFSFDLRLLKNEFDTFNFNQFVPNFTMKEKYYWHCSYLVFLIYVEWQQLKSVFEKENAEIYGTVNDLIESLFSIHPLKTLCSPVMDDYVHMLNAQIKMNLEGINFAIDFFLNNEDYLKKPEITLNFKQLSSFVPTSDQCFKLIKIIFSGNAELVNLFLKWYHNSENELKKELLQVRMLYLDSEISFKTSSFEEELLHFTNFAESNDISTFLDLLLQSVEETIEFIFESVIDSGQCKLHLIEMFAYVPFVCSYQSSSTDLQLVLKVLKPFFIAENHNRGLFDIASKFLEILPEDFSRHSFLTHLVYPNLSSDSGQTLHLFSDIVHMVLLDSLECNYTSWLKDMSPISLIAPLCSVLNYAITHSDPSLKRSIINIFKVILQLKETLPDFHSADFQKSLVNLMETQHPCVKLYCSDFLDEPNFDVTTSSVENLLSYCVIQHDNSPFINNPPTDRNEIVSAVAQVLRYFFLEETEELLNLLKQLTIFPTDEELDEKTNELICALKILCDALLIIESSEFKCDVIVMNLLSLLVSAVFETMPSILTVRKIFAIIVDVIHNLNSHQEGFEDYLVMLVRTFDTSSLNEDNKLQLISDIENIPKTDFRDQLLSSFLTTVEKIKEQEENEKQTLVKQFEEVIINEETEIQKELNDLEKNNT